MTLKCSFHLRLCTPRTRAGIALQRQFPKDRPARLFAGYSTCPAIRTLPGSQVDDFNDTRNCLYRGSQVDKTDAQSTHVTYRPYRMVGQDFLNLQFS
jgi:hypothetical protein